MGSAVTLGSPGAALAIPAAVTSEAITAAVRAVALRTGRWSHTLPKCSFQSYIACKIYNCRVIFATVDSTFDVLAEPQRRRILDLLRDGERPVGELVDRLELSQPGVSKHLRVLRDAGLVSVRPEGQRRWYGLRPEALAEVDRWLAPYRQLWGRRLDALERHLDEGKTK
jgi:DNA-binding transcriptional ArsR family regulator